MQPVIDVTDVVKRFGSTVALDGMNLVVQHGEVHGFVGPNGSGKTVTMRIVLGLLRHDSGHVRLFGGDPWRDAVDLHRRLAYVPGDTNLWPNLTGGEIIDLLADLRGGLDTTRRAQLIERFDLDPRTKARNYSKGNRQKLALVSALASDAELLILDEPTSGLDQLMEAVFQDCIVVSAASLPPLYPDQQSIDDYAHLFGDNPALVALAGPGYGFDDPDLGVILVNETQLWGMIGAGFVALGFEVVGSVALAGSLAAAFLARAVGDIADSPLRWASPIGWGQSVRAFALANRRDLGSGMVIKGATLVDAFFATSLALLAAVSTGALVGAVMRMRAEESAGRVESLWATPVSRWRWAGGHLVVVVAGTTGVLAASGVGLGLTYGVIIDQPGQVVRLTVASLAMLPGVLAIGSVGVVLLGWW